METGGFIDLEKIDNPKAEKLHKMSFGGSVVSGKRRLSDITNLVQREIKPRNKSTLEPGNPNLVLPMNAKDCSQLLKENTALLRLLGERNQVIEYTNLELQKLRMTVQKLQQQNWQLAQSNSQMFAELNMGRDRLKALQHELGCTLAVLSSKTLELEEKDKMNKTSYAKIDIMDPSKRNEIAENETHPPGGAKPVNQKWSSISLIITGEKNDDNKSKQSTRTRSANSKGQLGEPKCQFVPPSNNPVHEDQHMQFDSLASSSSNILLKEEKDTKLEDINSSINNPGEEKNKNRRRSTRYSGNLKYNSCESKLQAKSQVNDQMSESQCILLKEEKEDQLKEMNENRKNIRCSGKLKSRQCESKIQTTKSQQNDQVDENQYIQLDFCPVSSNSNASFSVEKEETLGDRNTSLIKGTDAILMEEREETLGETDTSLAKKETEKRFKARSFSPEFQSQELPGASSGGRPSRRVTIGISYKERPINIKMRRSS